MAEFSHIRGDAVRMVDVSGKAEVNRKAVATGRIHLRPETLTAIRDGAVVKGNVLATARVAATMAVKDTSRVIPMCHPIPIGSVEVGFTEGDGFLEATV
ncbi:MAG: cyclic pyranopterin monophosphate synthase MoaC, partial [Methanomicrobiales archaeon]|nr:cyclic pyranopterin monophosphate synthase MoaC [Methanomicrobiales archaeon]